MCHRVKKNQLLFRHPDCDQLMVKDFPFSNLQDLNQLSISISNFCCIKIFLYWILAYYCSALPLVVTQETTLLPMCTLHSTHWAFQKHRLDVEKYMYL